jgi:hypothetical protein
MHAFVHTYLHTYMHTFVHTHAYPCIRTAIHISIYIDTCTIIPRLISSHRPPNRPAGWCAYPSTVNTAPPPPLPPPTTTTITITTTFLCASVPSFIVLPSFLPLFFPWCPFFPSLRHRRTAGSGGQPEIEMELPLKGQLMMSLDLSKALDSKLLTNDQSPITNV